MSMGEAIRSVLQQNYANFNGRARRSEYWYWALTQAIVWIIVFILGLISRPLYVILLIVVILGLLLPNWAVGCRRLHDTGKSGWLQLIGIIPFIGGIVLLVFFCQDSQGDNQYGPSPKGIGGGFGGYGGYPQQPSPGYPPNYPPAQ